MANLLVDGISICLYICTGRERREGELSVGKSKALDLEFTVPDLGLSALSSGFSMLRFLLIRTGARSIANKHTQHL